MKDLIHKKCVVVESDLSITLSLQRMIDAKVSSVLVKDSKDQIVGIVTERDILRKIALLDVEMKLDRKINTIMTRPVSFARLQTLQKDIKNLASQRLRHFPVIKKEGSCHVENLVGIITLGDVGRYFLGCST